MNREQSITNIQRQKAKDTAMKQRTCYLNSAEPENKRGVILCNWFNFMVVGGNKLTGKFNGGSKTDTLNCNLFNGFVFMLHFPKAFNGNAFAFQYSSKRFYGLGLLNSALALKYSGDGYRNTRISPNRNRARQFEKYTIISRYRNRLCYGHDLNIPQKAA